MLISRSYTALVDRAPSRLLLRSPKPWKGSVSRRTSFATLSKGSTEERSKGVDVVLSSGFMAFAKHAGFLKAVDEHFYGGKHPHDHLSVKNITNAALCLLVFYLWWLTVDSAVVFLPRMPSWIQHPIGFVSLLLCSNVSVLFWVVGLLQRSFWLIDPFWTWIPFMIVFAYLSHPAAVEKDRNNRFPVMMLLLSVWSLRLTHSYFRREKLKFGEREDWRYTMIAKRCGRNWWWVSFWAVGFVQQWMLTGLTLPLYAVLLHPGTPWTLLDTVAAVSSLLGIVIAFLSDDALHHYTTKRPRPGGILRKGMWKYSRHPNYFGEMLFWWSLYLFAINHEQYWTFVGPLFNTLIFIATTQMTEERMINNWSRERVALYRKYQQCTSVWIPWFSSWDTT